MVTISYSGYRFPPEIIQHAIWLYIRFTLSFRDVEDLLAERGIMVSYETVRRWVRLMENFHQHQVAPCRRLGTVRRLDGARPSALLFVRSPAQRSCKARKRAFRRQYPADRHLLQSSNT